MSFRVGSLGHAWRDLEIRNWGPPHGLSINHTWVMAPPNPPNPKTGMSVPGWGGLALVYHPPLVPGDWSVSSVGKEQQTLSLCNPPGLCPESLPLTIVSYLYPFSIVSYDHEKNNFQWVLRVFVADDQIWGWLGTPWICNWSQKHKVVLDGDCLL